MLPQRIFRRGILACLAACMPFCSSPLSGDEPGHTADGSHEAALKITPIGRVVKEGDKTKIVLEEKYAPGLLGLDGFSHVYVYWWFDRNDTPEGRSVLQVHPRGNRNNPLTGVFATRSPRRPNLIAMTLCRIVRVEDNVLEVERIDAFAGTPVIDLKPYIPGYDTAEDASLPDWIGSRNGDASP